MFRFLYNLVVYAYKKTLYKFLSFGPVAFWFAWKRQRQENKERVIRYKELLVKAKAVEAAYFGSNEKALAERKRATKFDIHSVPVPMFAPVCESKVSSGREVVFPFTTATDFLSARDAYYQLTSDAHRKQVVKFMKKNKIAFFGYTKDYANNLDRSAFEQFMERYYKTHFKEHIQKLEEERLAKMTPEEKKELESLDLHRRFSVLEASMPFEDSSED